MPRRPAVFKPPGVRGRQQTRRDHDQDRARDPGRAARKRFYDSAEWKSARDRKLADNPICEDCIERGYIEAAREVDHHIPLVAAWHLRIDRTNLRSLCTPCHTRKTVRERVERRRGEGRVSSL
jgi:5-methylcytosine-specific restriction enzyme A